MEHPCVVGIDVSKAHLDVHVRPSGDSFRVGHDDAGFATLIARVRPFTPTLVVLEATGGYEVTVAAALAGARLPVAVVNPRRIRDFARATGQLAKTDALDARVIALFAEAVRPIARPVPDEQARALGALVARRRQLVDMLASSPDRPRPLPDLPAPRYRSGAPAAAAGPTPRARERGTERGAGSRHVLWTSDVPAPSGKTRQIGWATTMPLSRAQEHASPASLR